MGHYVLFAVVPKGKGDYGSDRKCLFDGKATNEAVMNKAFELSKRRRGTPVEVFLGKRLGRFLCTVSANGMKDGKTIVK